MSPSATAPAELLAALERVRRLSTYFSRVLQQELGLSIYQTGILAAIEDGARHLHQVAEATGQQVSSASRVVERLVSDGLLEREPDPTNRRAILLALTPAGESQLARSREVVGRLVNEALAQMPADQARELLPVLNVFLDTADEVFAARSAASD